MLRHLILIPTEQERRVLSPVMAAAIGGSARMELCGFGMVAAAARTAQLVAELAPARVLLVGIAGRLDDRLSLGEAYCFGKVSCYGIGAGTGSHFLSAESLGWQQWPGDPPDPAVAIADTISCANAGDTVVPRSEQLLTVCSAAASEADVVARKRMFPDAAAEDMEGFAVAVACRLNRVPVDIIRGISNTAGDRDKSHWQVTGALEAAAELAVRMMVNAT
jgi:futalosine hydrolase